MSFTSVPAASVDAKSPIDDALMGLVKSDLDDLDSRVIVAGASPYLFELQGKFDYFQNHKRSICGTVVNEAFQPSRCRYSLKKSGTTGGLSFDIRKHTEPKTPIIAISHQYSGGTTSIARETQIDTQSIARATTQISTQSITHAKASNAVLSITLLPSTAKIAGVVVANLVQYNLTSLIDADTVVGDSITFATCTAGGNNGTFTILEINRAGNPCVVVANGSGVLQTGAAGTGQIKIMSYNFTNPVNQYFTAGYSHIFASHTTGANNGTLLVYAINQAGNNIWVKNSTGVVQASTPGTVDSNIWIFALSSAALTSDYVAGESCQTFSHTSGLNDRGTAPIIGVNVGGNNLYLYNPVGVTQGGAAGHILSRRWIYAMPTDPSTQVSAGYGVYMAGHTNALNNGYFVVVEVNRNGANNIVVYNTAGVAQASTPGTAATTRKLVQFSADMSASYDTTSFVEMAECVDPLYNRFWSYSPFQVVQVNRGGGSNYNIVIETGTGANAAAASQLNPAGYVQTEMKSLFNTPPTLAIDLTGLQANNNLQGTSVDFVTATIAAGTPIMLYITTAPTAFAEDLTVYLR